MTVKRDTRCIDCGYDTEPLKPKRNYEQYIVRDSIWRAAGMLAGKLVPVEPDSKRFEIRGGGGCLCVGCIEERLGRKLRLSDFKGHTVWLLCRQHTDGWNSQRLSDAIFRFKAATKNFPPYERGLRMLRLAWSGHLIGGRTFAIVEDKEGRRDVVEISVGRPPRRRKRAR